MNRIKMKKQFIFSIIIFVFGLTSIFAQEISIGADVVSRYIWRGVDFGNSPAVQPALELSAGDFTVGSCGSYSIGKSDSGFGGLNEHDLYLSYNFGPVSIGVTDYYYPGAAGFFTFDADYNHVIEPYISYSGVISASLYMNALNDPDNSMYLELGYDLEVSEVELSLFAGAALSESVWYATDGAALISAGVTASKDNISVSYIINPDLEDTYLVFTYSF